MNINELNALASNLCDNDSKSSFITLSEELDDLNRTIEFTTMLVDWFIDELNELKEDRDRIAKDLNSYFEEK